MTISEVKRQTRLSEWRGQIQEQQSSGLTVKDWCEQRGYGQGRFYYWLRLVRTESIDRRYPRRRDGSTSAEGGRQVSHLGIPHVGVCILGAQ